MLPKQLSFRKFLGERSVSSRYFCLLRSRVTSKVRSIFIYEYTFSRSANCVKSGGQGSSTSITAPVKG